MSQSPELQSVINQLDSITSTKSMAGFATFAAGIMYSLFSKVKKRMVDTEGQEIGAKDLTNSIKETLDIGSNLKRNLDKQIKFISDKQRQEHQKLLINSRSNFSELQQIDTVVGKVKSNVKTGIDTVSQLVIEPALQSVKQIKTLNNIQGLNKIMSDVNIDQYQKARPLITNEEVDVIPDKKEVQAIESSLQM